MDDKDLQRKLHPAMVEGDHTYASVTDKISDVTLKKAYAVSLVHRLCHRVLDRSALLC